MPQFLSTQPAFLQISWLLRSVCVGGFLSPSPYASWLTGRGIGFCFQLQWTFFALIAVALYHAWSYHSAVFREYVEAHLTSKAAVLHRKWMPGTFLFYFISIFCVALNVYIPVGSWYMHITYFNSLISSPVPSFLHSFTHILVPSLFLYTFVIHNVYIPWVELAHTHSTIQIPLTPSSSFPSSSVPFDHIHSPMKKSI